MDNSIRLTVAALLIATATTAAYASEEITMIEAQSWVQDHQGTAWSGSSELWLDPTGNEAESSDATLQVTPDGIEYTWSFRGKAQAGKLDWNEDGRSWHDSWHQPEPVRLEPVSRHGSLLAGEYSYPAGSGPDWHWRIKLAQRPDDTLVLQMTNITPWGEEARAVRMLFKRSD